MVGHFSVLRGVALGGVKGYLGEGLNLIGVGSIPGLPEGQGPQALLNQLAATTQCLSMQLHNTPHYSTLSFMGTVLLSGQRNWNFIVYLRHRDAI